MNVVFKEQIGRNVEVYLDDFLIKRLRAKQHLANLRETFKVLRKYYMKLNPIKCAFGVASCKFLGFVVFERGKEANLEKV